MELPDSGQALRQSVDEPESFVRFYDFHAEALLTYFVRRTYDAEAALDLTAETFAQAYVSRHRFRGTTHAQASAWLYGIAKRQLARSFRKRAVEQRALRRLGIERPNIERDEQHRIEELAGLAGLRLAVRNGVTQLPAAQQEALQLRVVQELPYSQVAQRLEITEQAARARVSRGLRTLASVLDDNPSVKEIRA